jgi:hypothetical protein
MQRNLIHILQREQCCCACERIRATARILSLIALQPRSHCVCITISIRVNSCVTMLCHCLVCAHGMLCCDVQATVKYIDPSYMIRSVAANSFDQVSGVILLCISTLQCIYCVLFCNTARVSMMKNLL